MSLSGVQNVSFQGCKQAQNQQTQPAQQRKTGGAFPAIASLLVPGLGQAIDGRGKKGLKYFLTDVASMTASSLLAFLATNACKNGSRTGAIAAGVGAVVTSIACLVNKIKNVADAYQGEKCNNKVDTQA